MNITLFAPSWKPASLALCWAPVMQWAAVRTQVGAMRTPEQEEWQSLQSQLQRAREEREVAREQIQRLGEQLAVLQEESLSHALHFDGAARGDPATEPNAEQGKRKGWVKEMKERAERAKAKVHKH